MIKNSIIFTREQTTESERETNIRKQRRFQQVQRLSIFDKKDHSGNRMIEHHDHSLVMLHDQQTQGVLVQQQKRIFVFQDST